MAMANASMFAQPMFLNLWMENQKPHTLQTVSNAAHAWTHAPQRRSNTIPAKHRLEVLRQYYLEDMFFAYLRSLFLYHIQFF